MSAFWSGFTIGASNKATQLIDEERQREASREENIAANIAKRKSARESITHTANERIRAQTAIDNNEQTIKAKAAIADINVIEQFSKGTVSFSEATKQLSDPKSIEKLKLLRENVPEGHPEFNYKHNKTVAEYSALVKEGNSPEFAAAVALKGAPEEAIRALNVSKNARQDAEEAYPKLLNTYRKGENILKGISDGALSAGNRTGLKLTVTTGDIIDWKNVADTFTKLKNWAANTEDKALVDEANGTFGNKTQGAIMAYVTDLVCIRDSYGGRYSNFDRITKNKEVILQDMENGTLDIFTSPKLIAERVEGFQNDILTNLNQDVTALGDDHAWIKGTSPDVLNLIRKSNNIPQEMKRPLYLDSAANYNKLLSEGKKDPEARNRVRRDIEADYQAGRITKQKRDHMLRSQGWDTMTGSK